jgi:hypothetical protein
VATFEDVRTIALSLPETDEHASYGGRPSFRVRQKNFCYRRDETSLSVYVSDLGEKEALLASDSKKFFTTPHYDGYAMVCVRFGKVGVKELREIISDAWRSRAPKRVVAAFDADA